MLEIFSRRYYHNEKDIEDEEQMPDTTQNAENNNEIPELNLSNDNIGNNIEEPNLELDIPSSGFEETDAETPNHESSEERTRSNNILAEINIEAKNNRNIEKTVSVPPSNSSTPSISLTQSPSTETEIEPKPGCSTDSQSVPSSAEESTSANNTTQVKCRKTNNKVKPTATAAATTTTSTNNKHNAKSSLIPKMNTNEASTSNGIKMKKLSPRPSSNSNQSQLSSASLSGRDSGSDVSGGRYSSSAFESGHSEKKKEPLQSKMSNTGNINKTNRKLLKTDKNDNDTLAPPSSGGTSSRSVKRSPFSRKFSHNPTSANINISSDFCKDANQAKCDEQSNMFLYIDLHGHASKKGIFMYGNYLPKIAESVECMLLPRLMSLNSHHFHFDACVFSERNMYHK